MELPVFKYSPNAYDIDVFVNEDGRCSVCNNERNIRYDATFYANEDPEYICPWCIEDGNAAARFDGEFNDLASIENESNTIEIDKLKEVAMRTPNYVSWQQQVWLSHCNEPCAFIGYADSKRIKPILDELKEDIEVKIGFEPELIYNHLTTNGHIVGYLFKCLQCGKHRLHADCD